MDILLKVRGSISRSATCDFHIMKESIIEHGMIEISLHFITTFFFDVSSAPHASKDVSDKFNGRVLSRFSSAPTKCWCV